MFRIDGMKETITYLEFIQEDDEANIKRWWVDRRREHETDGCPLRQGAAGCVICKEPKVISR
jgi:hypothetical protein